MTAPLPSRFGGLNRMALITALVTGLSGVAKLALLLREMAAAYHFGTGTAMDALTMGLLVPNVLLNALVATVAIVLAPIYAETRETEGEAAAHALASRAMGALLLGLLAVCGMLALLAPWVLAAVGAGLDEATRTDATTLFRWLLPMVLFQGIVSGYGTLINAQGRFGLMAALPMVMPLLSVTALTLFAADFGIHALVLGIVTGSAVEAALALGLAARIGVAVRPRWPGSLSQRSAGPYGVAVAGAAMMSLAQVVDQAMAASLGPGSVAALAYGAKVSNAVLALVATPLSTVLIHYAARWVASAQWQALRQALWRGGLGSLLLTLPITAAVWLLSAPLIRLLLERGSFDAADTALVSTVQAYYILQLPFYVIGLMGVRVLNALQAHGAVLCIATVLLLVNVVLNLVFMELMGLPGIALSTAVVYALSATLVLSTVAYKLRQRSATS